MGQFKFLGDLRYTRLTSALFHQIKGTGPDTIIISGIEATGKRVVFKPRDADRMESDGVCNAETDADSLKDAYI